MADKPLTILGIDPGFAITGIGVVQVSGREVRLVMYDCVRTKAGEAFTNRLDKLSKGLKSIIDEFKPDLVAVEELFFASNAKTAMKVGQARGVVLLTAVQSGLPVMEFTPLQVKQAISGYGKADKQQIQQMVKLFLKLEEVPQPDDAADALAIAVCAAHSHKLSNIYEKK